jgi:hypothetical protein
MMPGGSYLVFCPSCADPLQGDMRGASQRIQSMREPGLHNLCNYSCSLVHLHLDADEYAGSARA